jgi:hypothetical protein
MNYKNHVLLLAPLSALVSADAYAYIDPASGNAIASFFIALFGSVLFFMKSLFYRVFSRSPAVVKADTGTGGEQCTPLLFSEGKTYWTTFRPIVEELIRQKIHFRYISLDVHDPGLMIDSEYMLAKRFTKNRLGFAKFSNLVSPVMLSTTPNIGAEGYPIARPIGVKSLVHVFHAMVDISCYRKGSLDYYDAVLMAGAHEEVSIRLVEKARGVQPKELVVVGLPCLDDLNRQKEESGFVEKTADSSRITVLIAPSWGAKGCFSEYGTGFVKTLSAAGYSVIIRPHPHSHIFEPESVERWRTETKNLDNVTWDTNTFGAPAMGQADILISDASSIRFDFAFLYKKPVISLSISRQSLSVFEGDYMPETWADTIAGEIGQVVNADQLQSLDQLVEEAITRYTSEKLVELRDKYVANFGASASVIVPYLEQKASFLSMTLQQQSMQQQLDALKGEMKDLRKQLAPNEPASTKALSG